MNECLDMNNVGMGGKDDTNSILWDYSAENIKVNTFSLLRKIYIFYKNWVFVTNSSLLILISLQPDGVHFWYL